MGWNVGSMSPRTLKSFSTPSSRSFTRSCIVQLKKTLSDLRQHPDSAKWANRWTSVFSGIAVIYNRIAPAHVDRWSSPSWYDLLVILGNFDESRMELNNLGLSFKHTQGMVLAFCGKVLRHSVPDWSHG